MKIPIHIIKTAHALCLKVAPVGMKGQRMVAIIYDKKYIEGIGIASLKTHPLQKQTSEYAFLHAEIDAIISASRHTTSPNRKFRLSHCSIYVHRIMPSGVVGLAKPCINCMMSLTEIYGISDVNWSENQTRKQ